MYIEYRKKHPYYGKYKIKISIYNGIWDRLREEKNQENVKKYLEKNYNKDEDFKWCGGWCIYIKNEDMFDDIFIAFPEHICYVYKPAPGYEDLEGVEENIEKILWFDKYPYKVTLSVNRSTYYDQVAWCEHNIKTDFKTSAGQQETGFYFMTSFDAMAFKLAFSDLVIKTVVANSKKAAIMLKERMEKTTREYYEYLEGESDGKQKR